MPVVLFPTTIVPAFAAGFKVGTGIGAGVGDLAAVGAGAVVVGIGAAFWATDVTAALIAVPMGSLGTTASLVTVGCRDGVVCAWHAMRLNAKALIK